MKLYVFDFEYIRFSVFRHLTRRINNIVNKVVGYLQQELSEKIILVEQLNDKDIPIFTHFFNIFVKLLTRIDFLNQIL